MRVVRDEALTPGGWQVGWVLGAILRSLDVLGFQGSFPSPKCPKPDRQHVVSYPLLWYPHRFTISAEIGVTMAEFCSAYLESSLQRKEPPWFQRVMLPVFRIQSEWDRQTNRSPSSYFHN